MIPDFLYGYLIHQDMLNIKVKKNINFCLRQNTDLFNIYERVNSNYADRVGPFFKEDGRYTWWRG